MSIVWFTGVIWCIYFGMAKKGGQEGGLKLHRLSCRLCSGDWAWLSVWQEHLSHTRIKYSNIQKANGHTWTHRELWTSAVTVAWMRSADGKLICISTQPHESITPRRLTDLSNGPIRRSPGSGWYLLGHLNSSVFREQSQETFLCVYCVYNILLILLLHVP